MAGRQSAMNTPNSGLLAGANEFVRSVIAELSALGIERHELSLCDHLCVRANSAEEYLESVKQISAFAHVIDTSEVNGRAITTLEFDTPLVAAGFSVPWVEVAEPKAGSPYPSGLEHAEFVPAMAMTTFLNRHRDLPFDLKAWSKPINPDARLPLDAGSVRFHDVSLGATVRIAAAVAGDRAGT